jgi:hypothetical protein
MSSDIRQTAALHHDNERQRFHRETYRMDSGYRIEHLRQQYTRIFHRVTEDWDDHNQESLRSDEMIEEGVILSTLGKIFHGVEQNRHFLGEMGKSIVRSSSNVVDFEFEPRKFAAEYISLTDFRIFIRAIPEGGGYSPIRPGTYYKHRLSAEEDGSWGIVIDLEMVIEQFREIQRMRKGERVPDELLGALFMFNLFHEHFHYLTELAAINLSGVRDRFQLYENYLENASWDEWFCKLKDCSKKTTGDRREFVAGENPKCNCGTQGIIKAVVGYQYPVEEAMANAHASKQLMKVMGKHTGWRQLIPYIELFIREKHPLGYAEFDCFKANKRFELGQRIMTRLLRGDVKMPKINILQHQLIERVGVNKVIDNEDSLFVGLLRVENAYQNSLVPDDMSDIPVIILNCHKYPLLGSNIDDFLRGF